MRKSVLAFLSFAALVSLFASAQTTDTKYSTHQTYSQVYLRQATTADVMYYNDDPMASSHAVGTAQLALDAGQERAVRRQLLTNAPANARWASVRTPTGREFAVNLYPFKHALDKDRN